MAEYPPPGWCYNGPARNKYASVNKKTKEESYFVSFFEDEPFIDMSVDGEKIRGTILQTPEHKTKLDLQTEEKMYTTFERKAYRRAPRTTTTTVTGCFSGWRGRVCGRKAYHHKM